MNRIFVSPYELKPAGSLNELSNGNRRQGCLLKYEFDDGLIGFSDIHPWVELGDLPLEKQLQQLKTGVLTTLTQQSLQLAQKDGALRSIKKSFFDPAIEIKNNFLLPPGSILHQAGLETKKNAGFKTVKLKAGLEYSKIISTLEILAKIGFKVRVDFNSLLDEKSFNSFITELKPFVLESIEYIEDPMPFSEKTWSLFNGIVPLALDNEFLKADFRGQSKLPFSVLVIKPAKMNIVNAEEICKTYALKATVTSYMDHPVGVMHALWVAQELKLKLGSDLLDAGCFTTQLYQQDVFSEKIEFTGPKLIPSSGFGIGFDEIFEGLSWQPL